jgi:hypothetical protein
VSRLPFAIGIPLVAALMVAGIGIPFGILFIQADHWKGPDAALIVALGIALAILFSAVALTVIDERNPRPTETGVKASTTGFASTAPQANPRQTGKQEPPRRRGSGGSGSDRKRSR